MWAFDHELGQTIVGIIAPICVMVGVVVTSIYAYKSNIGMKRINKQVTRNGHSGKIPDDQDGSADALVKQVTYIATKIDDHAQASSQRFDTLDARQLEIDKQVNELRKAMVWAFMQHDRQHKKEWAVQHKKDQEQEIAILKAQGRLPDDSG